MRILDRIMVCLYLLVAAVPYVAFRLKWKDHTIAGYIPPTPYPKRSIAGVLDESFQKGYTAWFESRLGFRGYSVTTDNSLLYWLFGETRPGATTRVGLDGYLFHKEDILHFNTREDWMPTRQRVDALADRVAAMQNAFRARGRAFVPVIIPTKTSVYREKIPSSLWLELGLPRPSDVGIYDAFKLALEARHVEYVDAREMFTSGREPRGALWSKKARHWSSYGACRVMERVAASYAKLTRKAPLPYDCTLEWRFFDAGGWSPRMALTNDEFDDYDLFGLLNVWRPHPAGFKAPIAVHTPPPATYVTKPSLLMIGTSFCWNLMRDAGASQVFSEVVMNYYNNELIPFAPMEVPKVHAHTQEWRDFFLTKDLYVFDMFEGFLLTTQDTYVEQFLNDMEPELAKGTASP